MANLAGGAGGVQRASTRTTALSQHCACGVRVTKRLSDRVHRCPACGLTGDRDAVASVFGNTDVGTALRPLSVGGKIILTAGIGEGGTNGSGGSARIEAFSRDTIRLEFPKLSRGGYTVNGKEVVVDGDSGFFVGRDEAAVLDRNLFVKYGQGSAPPFDPTGANVTAGERGALFPFQRARPGEEDPTLPSCR